MEVHQTAFVQAVALAGIVALSMTGWEKGRGETRTQAGGTAPRTAVTQAGIKGSYIVAATRKGEVQP
jgi:hypothetical protein